MKTKSKVPYFVLLVMFALVIVGCAAIIHGTRQDIAVSSSPGRATVTVSGRIEATTPGIIELRRKDTNIVLRFEKEGYEPVEVALRRSVDGWIVGNIIFGGLIGLVVDFASGAAYKLSPAEVNVVLQKSGINLQSLPKDVDLVVYVNMELLKRIRE